MNVLRGNDFITRSRSLAHDYLKQNYVSEKMRTMDWLIIKQILTWPLGHKSDTFCYMKLSWSEKIL